MSSIKSETSYEQCQARRPILRIDADVRRLTDVTPWYMHTKKQREIEKIYKH
jgi:hypothetical protein